MRMLFLVFAIGFVLFLIPQIARLARTFVRFSGTRYMMCPLNKRIAKVRLDAVHAAWTSVMGKTELRITSCSGWPARKDCSTDCLTRLKASRNPESVPKGSVA
jgi:hypothetical protein